VVSGVTVAALAFISIFATWPSLEAGFLSVESVCYVVSAVEQSKKKGQEDLYRVRLTNLVTTQDGSGNFTAYAYDTMWQLHTIDQKVVDFVASCLRIMTRTSAQIDFLDRYTVGGKYSCWYTGSPCSSDSSNVCSSVRVFMTKDVDVAVIFLPAIILVTLIGVLRYSFNTWHKFKDTRHKWLSMNARQSMRHIVSPDREIEMALSNTTSG